MVLREAATQENHGFGGLATQNTPPRNKWCPPPTWMGRKIQLVCSEQLAHLVFGPEAQDVTSSSGAKLCWLALSSQRLRGTLTTDVCERSAHHIPNEFTGFGAMDVTKP